VEISEGILELVQHKRLSAVSSLTNMPNWPVYAKDLSAYKNQIDMGLHLNLTEGKPCVARKFSSLSQLLMNAYLGNIDQKEIEAEFNAQIDQFSAITGCAPDFIDGHQHIHHFPIIRDVLLKIYLQRFPENKIYIRNTSNSWKNYFKNRTAFAKQWIIAWTGAISFKKKLNALGIPYNKSFSGIYNFQNSNYYPNYFPRFLQQVESGGLIMCHPGKFVPHFSNTSTKIATIIDNARYQEYQYFMSEPFLQACKQQHVTLGPLSS
jgi:predicted glycoside hydrolase/deacetylase ChbG (UPF0249 family)